jgi:hypothetical protein
MDVTKLLRQSCSWEKVTSTNNRDDPTYAAAVTLACRKVARLKDLIGKDGEVTTSSNQFTLPPNSTVAIDDLLDGRQVIAVSDMVTTGGQSVGYLVLTR